MSSNLRRPRSESDCSASERPTHRQRLGDSPEVLILRDALFYRDGGDCFLRAEDHLFKIHRYHLLRGDSSVFKDMFLVPSGEHPSQGLSDSDPIVLAGDTAERVRGFFSIAYAEPLEFQVVETGKEQLPTLIHCAHFSHKYNITPLLLAAIKAIDHVLKAKPALDSQLYISLLELSSLGGAIVLNAWRDYKSQIRSGVEWSWAHHLIRHSNIMDVEDISLALDTAEEHALPHMLAIGSQIYLSKMHRNPSPRIGIAIVPPFHDHPWLKTTHRLRILSGLWSLEHAWMDFAAAVPVFPPDHVCPKKNHAVCVKRWEKEWRRAVTSPKVVAVPSASMTSRLLVLQKEIEPAFESPCILAGFKGAHCPTKAFPTGHKHFLDPVLATT
ncbi:hypothetical protein DFH07DRAFT_1059889 [Mycena maculata]|uniref:BTB domain-containing protein n=1 Tax=Mycena maculata TaxID=230809 RepID=A0AAD7NI01_9AGAR|nr:hypothetical protein DFH07DRAFT_1059889 [Mycena maculata]